jgi:CRP-like cAMP-binding protein
MAASRLLDAIPDEELRTLLAAARRRSFARNEVVFHQGDPGDSMHLVWNGRFAARIRTRLGDQTTVAIVGPGDVFGELALVGQDRERSATVVALEPGETRSIGRQDLDRLRHELPEVDELLLRLLASRLRRTNDLLAEALYVPADVRVIRRLRELAALYGADSVDDSTRGGGGEAVIPLTQDEIAELAGTSRATVNRVLRAEQRAGAVRLTRGRTSIVDAGRLGHG